MVFLAGKNNRHRLMKWLLGVMLLFWQVTHTELQCVVMKFWVTPVHRPTALALHIGTPLKTQYTLLTRRSGWG